MGQSVTRCIQQFRNPGPVVTSPSLPTAESRWGFHRPRECQTPIDMRSSSAARFLTSTLSQPPKLRFPPSRCLDLLRAIGSPHSSRISWGRSRSHGDSRWTLLGWNPSLSTRPGHRHERRHDPHSVQILPVGEIFREKACATLGPGRSHAEAFPEGEPPPCLHVPGVFDEPNRQRQRKPGLKSEHLLPGLLIWKGGAAARDHCFAAERSSDAV